MAVPSQTMGPAFASAQWELQGSVQDSCVRMVMLPQALLWASGIRSLRLWSFPEPQVDLGVTMTQETKRGEGARQDMCSFNPTLLQLHFYFKIHLFMVLNVSC